MTELAVRGPIYTLVADPFLNAPADCVVYESDGLMLIGNGLIHDMPICATNCQRILTCGIIQMPY